MGMKKVERYGEGRGRGEGAGWGGDGRIGALCQHPILGCWGGLSKNEEKFA